MRAATNVKGGDEGNYANLNANGTGPFMVTSRQSGVKTVLKRNPNYWGKLKTNITEAIFTPIDQDATRVAALISGNVTWPTRSRCRTGSVWKMPPV